MKNVYFWQTDLGIEYVVQVNGCHVKSGSCEKLSQLKKKYPEIWYTYCEERYEY